MFFTNLYEWVVLNFARYSRNTSRHFKALPSVLLATLPEFLLTAIFQINLTYYPKCKQGQTVLFLNLLSDLKQKKLQSRRAI